MQLNVCTAEWPVPAADAILCINMVHIAPWEAALCLLNGAASLLGEKAPLILYGPWLEANVPTAPSNQAFDLSLRDRDPRWGLRLVEDFTAEGQRRGFQLAGRRPMPSNNLMASLREALNEVLPL